MTDAQTPGVVLNGIVRRARNPWALAPHRLPELPGSLHPDPALVHADGREEELEQCQPGESQPDHPAIDLVRVGREPALQANRPGPLKPGEHQDRQERATPKKTGTQGFLAPRFEEPVSLACDVGHGTRPRSWNEANHAGAARHDTERSRSPVRAAREASGPPL